MSDNESWLARYDEAVAAGVVSAVIDQSSLLSIWARCKRPE